jgi:biopolymer transport protein ExbD
MINFKQTEYVKPLPALQLVALIDILFVTLAFFMAIFLTFNFEAELNISVPVAAASKESRVSPSEIIVNIMRDGTVIINQKQVSLEGLSAILRKTAQIYPSQEIIIRADEKAFHEYVVKVLDVCAKANIWNISFATTREK